MDFATERRRNPPIVKANFVFDDADKDTLATLSILTAPEKGELLLNGQPVRDGDQ